MKAIAAIAGLAVIGSAVAFGLLSGKDREGQDLDPKMSTEPEAPKETAELAGATVIPEAEPELIDFDPFLEGKRTTAPKLEELSYENPIVQYHPDRSVTTHKLARITLADGTVKEVPVQMHARLAKKPMEVKSRGDSIMLLREERNDPEFGKPRKPVGGDANKPMTGGSSAQSDSDQ